MLVPRAAVAPIMQPIGSGPLAVAVESKERSREDHDEKYHLK